MDFKRIIPVLIIILGTLSFYQNCAKYPYQDSSSVSSNSLEMKKYYLIDNSYTCLNSKNQTIPSYINSIYIYNGDLCETGDLCQNKTDCKPWPASLVFASDLQSVQYKGETYLYLANPPLY